MADIFEVRKKSVKMVELPEVKEARESCLRGPMSDGNQKLHPVIQ